MPHLPTTSQERREADRERKVERVMSDQRFQWTPDRFLASLLPSAVVAWLDRGENSVLAGESA
jgi:hypothetical protein